MTPVTDEALLSGFEAGRLDAFHHADHVHVAWIYLSRLPFVEALDAFTRHLKQFAAAAGKPDLYHETITVAYLLLIQDRIARRGRGRTWDDFAGANSDLLVWRPSILKQYYSDELLASKTARQAFVWPDKMTTCI